MKKSSFDYLIVAAVVACCAVLLVALTTALSGSRLKGGSRRISIDYTDVAGIQLHSELRYAGAPAGEVIEVRALSGEERLKSPAGPEAAVRVTASIRDDIPPIPSDTKPFIGSDTLLSEKFVALSAGSPKAAPLPNGAILTGQPGMSLDTLAAKLDPVLNNANAALVDIRANLNELLPRIQDLSTDMQTTAKSATALIQRAEKLIDDNEEGIHDRIEKLGVILDDLQKLLGESQKTMANANSAVTNVNKFVGNTDKEFQARMEELSVVLQNLKVVTTQAKAITRSIAEKPSRLIWGFGKPAQLTPDEEIIESDKPVPATRNRGRR